MHPQQKTLFLLTFPSPLQSPNPQMYLMKQHFKTISYADLFSYCLAKTLWLVFPLLPVHVCICVWSASNCQCVAAVPQSEMRYHKLWVSTAGSLLLLPVCAYSTLSHMYLNMRSSHTDGFSLTVKAAGNKVKSETMQIKKEMIQPKPTNHYWGALSKALLDIVTFTCACLSFHSSPCFNLYSSNIVRTSAVKTR